MGMRLFLVLLVTCAVRAWFGWINAGIVPGWNGDLGQIVDASDRILLGQAPCRDFSGLYGPLLYWIYAGLYKAFGADWYSAALQSDLILPLLTLPLAAMVARAFLGRGWAAPAFLALSFLLGLDWWAGLRVWPALAAVALAFHGRFRLAWISAGIVLLLSPEAGVGTVLALGTIALFAFPLDRISRLRSSVLLLLPLAATELLVPGVLRPYLETTLGLARVTNYYAGLPFPMPGFNLAAFAFYSPFLLVVAGIVLSVRGILRDEPARSEEHSANLALSLAGAVLLRAALGRSDAGHLLFSLPVVLLLAFRLAREFRGGNASLAVSALLFIAWARPNTMEAWPAGGFKVPSVTGTSEISAERVRVPSPLAERTARIGSYLKRTAPPRTSVLFLPLPFQSHIFGRAPVLSLLLPEHLVVSGRTATRAITWLERADVRLVLLDRQACLPSGPDTNWGTSDFLNWESPADEVILRELRSWLTANFRESGEIPGTDVVIYKRRARAMVPPRTRVTGRFPLSSEQTGRLADGGEVGIDVPYTRCDEIRVPVKCSYLPGFASLAKTLLQVEIRFADGTSRLARLPVPPSSLGKELRFKSDGRSIARLTLSLVVPGALAPRPRGVELPALDLVWTSRP